MFKTLLKHTFVSLLFTLTLLWLLLMSNNYNFSAVSALVNTQVKMG